MRPDMNKVIEERARTRASEHNKRAARRKAKQAISQEKDLEKIESIKKNNSCPYRDDAKVKNVNIAPFQRWLRSQVGRPWDSVYSEICETVERRLHRYINVRQDVFEVDGVPYRNHRGIGYLLPGEELYLHEGILKESKNPPFNKDAYKAQFKRPHLAGLVRESEKVAYRKIKGIWFELKLERILPGFSCYDVALKKSFTLSRSGQSVELSYPTLVEMVRAKDRTNNHREFYGNSKVYCREKRQLSSREIQKLKLNEME